MILSSVLFEIITRVAIEAFDDDEFDKDEIQARIDDCHDYHCTEEERQFIRDLNWDTLLYPDIRSFVIRNDHPNKRRRGPLVFEKATPAGLTLRDIAEGVMHVKENKDDFWYELFCGFSEESVVDGRATYVADFDHGS